LITPLSRVSPSPLDSHRHQACEEGPRFPAATS